jgi:hypothetical protein
MLHEIIFGLPLLLMMIQPNPFPPNYSIFCHHPFWKQIMMCRWEGIYWEEEGGKLMIIPSQPISQPIRLCPICLKHKIHTTHFLLQMTEDHIAKLKVN